MEKDEYTIELPAFEYYWGKFMSFLKKPIQKKLDRRFKLKHYGRILAENKELKSQVDILKDQLWKKYIRLKESNRLLTVALEKERGIGIREDTIVSATAPDSVEKVGKE